MGFLPENLVVVVQQLNYDEPHSYPDCSLIAKGLIALTVVQAWQAQQYL